MAVRNVKMFVDFWNFQLRWNENMRPADANNGHVRMSWEKLPGVIMAELPSIFGTSDPLSFKGNNILDSVAGDR